MLFQDLISFYRSHPVVLHNNYQAASVIESFFSRQYEAMLYWYKQSMFPICSTVNKAAVDIIENEEEVIVVMEAPGVTSQDIQLLAKQCDLYITCNKKAGGEVEEGYYVLHELPPVYMKRVIRFPEHTDTTNAVAILEKGMLIVKIPKSTTEGKMPETVAIIETPQPSKSITIASAA